MAGLGQFHGLDGPLQLLPQFHGYDLFSIKQAARLFDVSPETHHGIALPDGLNRLRRH